MIGKIKGTLIDVDGNIGLIETPSGVSYQVYLPPSLLAALIPAPIEAFTYLQVRDDALVLFGFPSKAEYQFFTLLLTVPGVGPKSAFTVISFAKPEAIISAVTSNDVAYFSKIPGLGKKTAMKIILELSQKLKSEFKFEEMVTSDDDKTAIDALVSLGFPSQQAKQILSKLPKDLTLEQKIQEGIRLGTSGKK